MYTWSKLFTGSVTIEVLLVISINRSIRFLYFAVAFLIIAGWSVQFYASIFKPEEFQNKNCHGIIRMFYLDGEANLPTWYQSTTLLLCSLLLAAIWSNSKGSWFRRHWGMLSVIFLFLSLDEAACIHEAISSLLSQFIHTTGIFTYAWVIPGGVFTLVVLLSSLHFLRHLPKRTKRDFIIAGAIYVSGALGWEMAGGWYDSLHGSRNLTYMTLTVCEEAFECVGIILFIRSLLIYLKNLPANRNTSVSPSPSPQDIPVVALSIGD